MARGSGQGLTDEGPVRLLDIERANEQETDEELAAIAEQGNDAETGAGDDGAHRRRHEHGPARRSTLPGDEDGPTTNVVRRCW